jgi:hypothetical protein
MEVFLVAYICFNLNLEIYTGNRAVYIFSAIENTIAKVRFSDESFMF